MGMKRGTSAGVIAAAVLLATGGAGVAFAQSGPGEVAAPAPAVASGPSEGSVITGDYYVWLHTVDDTGQGLVTGIAPHTTQDLGTTLHGGGFSPTALEFSVGAEPDGPTVASYGILAPGGFVACSAAGSEVAPDIRCDR
jgi:hypothetical protein